VSAVATQPRVALRAVAIRVAVAPLTVVVAVSAVVRTLAAWTRATPAYFPDEYMYSEFGRSFAHGTMPGVRGAPAHFLPILQPLVTSPGWLFSSVDEGYRAVQAIEATFMSLAAIPVYVLSRRLGLSSRYSVVAAALSLTIPSLIMSGFIVSEPIAYPIVLAAIAAAVHALDRPSWRSYSLFLGFAALAALTRMQFAVLLPIFVVAVLLVALRECRLGEFLRLHRIPLAAFVVVAGGIFALGPARNTGYYPSFLYIPHFHAATAGEYLAVDMLVLVFASGFVLAPGAFLGIWLAVTSRRSRAELAFGVLSLLLTLALLVQAVLYGNLGFVQERYLFYLLPLWTISFLLYAERGWPLRRSHAAVATGLVVAALALPLSKYAVGGGQAHSAFLFALTGIERAAGSIGAAAVLIAYTAGLAVFVLLFLAFRRPRAVAPFALGFALLATAASSVSATSYDHANTRSIKNVVLGDNPSFVDASGVGPTTLLLAPGSRMSDAKLFWNRSIDRLLLLPGAKLPDSFLASTVAVRADGVVTVAKQPVTGPVLIDDWSTGVQLQQAKLVERTASGALYRPNGDLRLGMLAVGRYEDGWLRSSGAVVVWPAAGAAGVYGRLEIPVRAPGPGTTTTLRIAKPGATHPLSYTATYSRTRTIAIELCASGPVVIPFTAAPLRGLGDGRGVAAWTGKPRFVPSTAACSATKS
jgi:hypothetical protein